MSLLMCVCVCVCVNERESVCVCVFVCAHMICLGMLNVKKGDCIHITAIRCDGMLTGVIKSPYGVIVGDIPVQYTHLSYISGPSKLIGMRERERERERESSCVVCE